MKIKFLVILLMSTLLFACTENGNEINDLTGNNKNSGNKENTDFEDLKSQLFLITNKSDVSLNEIDEFYKDKILASNEQNIKHLGFYMMMKHGLAESSDSKNKFFYINEQLGLDQNVANITNFYTLLRSCEDCFSEEKLMEIEKVFYEKNYNRIVNQKWENKELQNEKKISLMRRHKFFHRYYNFN